MEREELISAAVDTAELDSANMGITRRADDLAPPVFPGLPEAMAAAGYGNVAELRAFIEENEAEIWRRLGDNWFALLETRRDLEGE
jgi:hypothetical protein